MGTGADTGDLKIGRKGEGLRNRRDAGPGNFFAGDDKDITRRKAQTSGRRETEVTSRLASSAMESARSSRKTSA